MYVLQTQKMRVANLWYRRVLVCGTNQKLRMWFWIANEADPILYLQRSSLPGVCEERCGSDFGQRLLGIVQDSLAHPDDRYLVAWRQTRPGQRWELTHNRVQYLHVVLNESIKSKEPVKTESVALGIAVVWWLTRLVSQLANPVWDPLKVTAFYPTFPVAIDGYATDNWPVS